MMPQYAQAALDQIRQGHAQLVNESPVELTLLRRTRGRAGGAFSQWSDDPAGGLGPYICRVAWKDGRPVQVGQDAGVQQRDSSYLLSMPENTALGVADLDENTSRIEIQHPQLGRMRLRNLKPMMVFSRTIGWQADLEAIK